jgi:SAM-dependent methyltransferase
VRESLIDRRTVERLFVVAGALRAGIIDALAGSEPVTASQVAASASTDPRATEIVLEALVAEKLADRQGPLPEPPMRDSAAGSVPGAADSAQGAAAGEPVAALYRLSPLARAHLVDPGPDLERWGLLHQARKARGWLELSDVIQTGKAQRRDPVERDLKTMVSAMGERDPAIVEEVVDRCLAYAGHAATMIDIGGAVGHLARQFARCGVRATLLDRPDVLPVAREFLGEEGRDIALVPGDLTESLPAGPFDLVYFGNVLHIYSQATNARVIREAYPVVAPGGTVAIQGYLWGRSERGAMFAVNMLQAAEDGGVWSEAQYRGWLNDAGFANIEVFDLETAGTQLILARKSLES